MKNRTIKGLISLAVIQGLLLVPMHGFAQGTSVNIIEEVLVTAQKREESSRDIASSLSVVSDQQLDDSQVINVLDIAAFSPNVSVGHDFGIARIFVRGIGLVSPFMGVDPSVALHVDGVVVSPGHAQMGLFYDLERMEVLRGPQGSLYGRNSTGGSINLISKKPTEETEGYAKVTVGDYNAVTAELAVGGAIIEDKLLGRIALKRHTRDGYGENETFNNDIDDADHLSGRLHLEYRPTDNLNILLTGSWQEQDDDGFQLKYIEADGTNHPGTLPPIGAPGFTSENPRNIKSNYPLTNNVRNTDAYTATVVWDINDNYSLHSITGTRDFESLQIQDLESSMIPALVSRFTIAAESTTQEFQLHYQNDDLFAMVGYYFYDEKLTNDTPLGIDPMGVNGPADVIVNVQGVMDIEATAIFGHVDYDINDKWSIVLGGRYSSEEREKADLFTIPGAKIPFADAGDWDDFTFDVGIQYHPTADVNFYAKFAQGFKSGAANLGQISAFVEPETVDSFEIGVKGLFLDKSLSLNAAAFYYDFKDMQLAKTVAAPGGGFGSFLENAGKSEVTGLELELQWLLTSNFRFEAMLGYLDSEIKDFISINEIDPCAGVTAGCDPLVKGTFIAQQQAGNRLVQAPKQTANVQAKYQFNLDNGATITVGAGSYYRSEIFFTPFNSSNVQADGATIYNANIKYIHPGEKFELNVWGKNLTDKDVWGSKFPVSSSHIIMGTLTPPSTYGVTLSYDF